VSSGLYLYYGLNLGLLHWQGSGAGARFWVLWRTATVFSASLGGRACLPRYLPACALSGGAFTCVCIPPSLLSHTAACTYTTTATTCLHLHYLPPASPAYIHTAALLPTHACATFLYRSLPATSRHLTACLL